mmetsp:Transcript_30344/g.87527  ORF Transcript_30344/g.87527 Transcript_30344/m.87527 type:complete len:209 (+) Transcript_30344:1739-2365(+)
MTTWAPTSCGFRWPCGSWTTPATRTTSSALRSGATGPPGAPSSPGRCGREPATLPGCGVPIEPAWGRGARRRPPSRHSPPCLAACRRRRPCLWGRARCRSVGHTPATRASSSGGRRSSPCRSMPCSSSAAARREAALFLNPWCTRSTPRRHTRSSPAWQRTRSTASRSMRTTSPAPGHGALPATASSRMRAHRWPRRRRWPSRWRWMG